MSFITCTIFVVSMHLVPVRHLLSVDTARVYSKPPPIDGGCCAAPSVSDVLGSMLGQPVPTSCCVVEIPGCCCTTGPTTTEAGSAGTVAAPCQNNGALLASTTLFVYSAQKRRHFVVMHNTCGAPRDRQFAMRPPRGSASLWSADLSTLYRIHRVIRC